MAALLFDLDGTLADTKPDLHAAMNFVLRQNGLDEVPDEAITNMIGGGARMILQRGLEANETRWDDAKLDAATEEFVLWYDQNIDGHTKIYPNLMPILDAAKAAQIPMAVVTNKRESLSAKLLYRLGLQGYFDALVGGDTLPKRKPDPDTIELALARLGCAPQDAIMVGDSEADSDGARAANVACICVSFGYRRVSLEELKADAIIDDYAEFAAAAKAIKPGLFDALSLE
ncbi:MAG TPA: phosphoglycolate phosphatase [Rhodobiaceae bacterium]|nr:phosphoglycolate phosphatase [Rhodobiaceae bacterium]